MSVVIEPLSRGSYIIHTPIFSAYVCKHIGEPWMDDDEEEFEDPFILEEREEYWLCRQQSVDQYLHEYSRGRTNLTLDQWLEENHAPAQEEAEGANGESEAESQDPDAGWDWLG